MDDGGGECCAVSWVGSSLRQEAKADTGIAQKWVIWRE